MKPPASKAALCRVDLDLRDLKLDLRKLVEQSPRSIMLLLESAGLDESTYYSWQNGRVHSPTLSTLIPMANVTGARLCLVQAGEVKASDYTIMPWLLRSLKKKRAAYPELRLWQNTIYHWRKDLSAPKISSLLLILNILDYQLVFRKLTE